MKFQALNSVKLRDSSLKSIWKICVQLHKTETPLHNRSQLGLNKRILCSKIRENSTWTEYYSWLIDIAQSAHSTNKDIHSCETRTLPWAFLHITNRDIFFCFDAFLLVASLVASLDWFKFGYALVHIYLHYSAMDMRFVWDHWLIAIFRAHWLKCCRDSKSSSSGLNNKCVNYPFVKTSFSSLALKSKHMKFSFFSRFSWTLSSSSE